MPYHVMSLQEYINFEMRSYNVTSPGRHSDWCARMTSAKGWPPDQRGAGHESYDRVDRS